MRIAYGVAVGLLAFSPFVAVAEGLPSYTQPDLNQKPDQSAGQGVVGKLTTREVTERLFKATADTRPDLKGLDLSRLDLAELDFKRAQLDGSDLYATDITRANLNGSSLVGARLDRTTLTGADFSGADLTDVRIFARPFSRASRRPQPRRRSSSAPSWCGFAPTAGSTGLISRMQT